MSRKYFLFNLCVVLLSFAFSFLASYLLPEKIAIHWNYLGQADDFASTIPAVFLIPGLMASLLVIMQLIHMYRAQQNKIVQFIETYSYICSITLVFFAYVNVVLVSANLIQNFDLLNYLIVAVAILFLIIGNVMPKIRINSVLGIRTPWTLNNENVWFHTHRFAGRLFIATSLLILIVTFLDFSKVFTVSLFFASLLVPVIYSYCIKNNFKNSYN
jgi:uncharacterized membrane protein